MLTPETLPTLQRALAEADLDGWLLYDFQGNNPIANGLLALEGMVSRRVFVFVPREGVPRALGHAIEAGPWRRWRRRGRVRRTARGESSSPRSPTWCAASASPWSIRRATRCRISIACRRECSRWCAPPVPASVVSSGALVTRFYASWTDAQLASHIRSAELIAAIARDAFALAGERAGTREPATEHELMLWIRERFDRAGLVTDHGPSVCAGESSANPHYEPSGERPRAIVDGDVLLIDLWATEPQGVYADQTWMGFVGTPTARAMEVWSVVCDARDAPSRWCRAPRRRDACCAAPTWTTRRAR
jgi:hypothetical protein